ncbi:MAG: hypothetical protein ACI8WB_000343 [Phenylobacterium sp.]|jgi:hypothetical protein
MSSYELKNEIDITDITPTLAMVPEGCPSDCPVLQSSQTTAIQIAAQAQSLFQGFLNCLHKLEPDSEFGPESKKGSTMLGHFTSKLDLALATEYTHASQCDYVQQGGTCFKDFNQQKERNDETLEDNALLQSKCQTLENKVERLLNELSKRRTQYNNRVLVQILIDQYKTMLDAGDNDSFFDMVPRDQLATFLPFLRNIVLGPAIANQFDAELTVALEQYTDHNGHIDARIWHEVMIDEQVVNIMLWLREALCERSQRRKAFRTLLQRQSPVSEKKLPILIAMFETMGSVAIAS